MVTTRSSNTGQPRGSLQQRGRGVSNTGKGGRRERRLGEEQSSNNRDQTPHSDSAEPNVDVTRFTLENYESLLDQWSDKQLRDVLGKQNDLSNQIPPEIKEALEFHKMNYTKIKSALTLIGNVSMKMVNSWLGEDKPSRRKSCWNRFVAFSKESAITPVPPKGSPYGWDERNGHLGFTWKTTLSADERMVFNARIFRHFSKIPIAYEGEHDDEDSEDEGDEGTIKDLITSDEEALYQPLYEHLVNHEKVKLMISGKIPDSSSNPEKQVINHIIRINSELFTLANQYNLTYYLLTATRYPGRGSFCKELSNDPIWLKVALEKWSAEITFEAYSQGRTIQDVVDDIDGPSSKKRKRSDMVRTNLREALNEQLRKVTGAQKVKFPKFADPETALLAKYPRLRIVQSEESTLTKDVLALGVESMHTEFREKWLNDISTGAFRIVITPNSEE
ncbi:hypothetical protein MJO28_016932 [Puccinia striiformis f. sp. tritici]|nr:hypothetical protein MJO28_016932 [Puccinia striiformis f. sp. tritici]